MAFSSATPRNSASSNGTTSPASVTITSTTAGDLGVVALAVYHASTQATVTPPTGWIGFDPNSNPISGASTCQLFLYYRPNMPAGTTSLSFTLSAVSRYILAYGCWGGGGSGSVAEAYHFTGGVEVPNGNYLQVGSGGTSSLVTIGTVRGTADTDIALFGIAQNANVANGLPTGFTSVISTTAGTGSSQLSLRFAAVLMGAEGSYATASGQTLGGTAEFAQGIFPITSVSPRLRPSVVGFNTVRQPLMQRSGLWASRVPWKERLSGLVAPPIGLVT